MTPILRATYAEISRAALAQQIETNARCMDALRSLIARNQQQTEAVERMAAKLWNPVAYRKPVAFDHALEVLLFAARNGVDCTEERAAVHRLFCARLDADPEMAEGLEITLGVVREGVQRG